MKNLRSLEIHNNDTGVSDYVENGKNAYLAYAYVEKGEVILMDALNQNPINVIRAHKSQVEKISFSGDGSLLATCSTVGTIIRIFSIPKCELICSLRRGSSSATIYSINFSLSKKYLIIGSDTNTVHIFKIEKYIFYP
jgi:WD40 repeat protein